VKLLATLLRIWPHLFTAAYLAVALVASAHVVLYKRDVRAAIGWVGLIWFSPFVGAILYVFFGINRLRRKATRRMEDESLEQPPPPLATPGGTGLAEPDEEAFVARTEPHLLGLGQFVGKATDVPLTAGNLVAPLVNGDEAYPAMIEAISRARRSVALCSYIFDNDRAGLMFLDALGNAARRGIEVRVLIDSVGAKYSRPPITKLLAAGGVPVAKFMDSPIPFRNPYMNLRNHRKIMVVDGRIAFTGGMNIREACLLHRDPPHPVRDLHFSVEGPVVREIMDAFAADWSFTTQEQLQGEAWYPEIEPRGTIVARGIPDGPDEDFETIRWAIHGALSVAQRSVRIMTPYFLPDQSLITTLNLAAMRGVEVDVILPEICNLRFVQWASMAQLWQVLERGCRVWLSPPPFDHSKIMLVDDAWLLVGSANWDPRSLRLNFEFNIECYDAELVSVLAALVAERRSASKELTLADVNGRSLPVKLRDGVARLMSPYL
jgi:cardiolipin synthase